MGSEIDWRRIGQAAGLTRRDLARYQELQLITISDWPPSDMLLRRLRRIHRLRRDLGLGPEAAAVVLRLIDHVESARGQGRPPHWAARVIDE